MEIQTKPELLAPAGTLDAVSAVLEAGADAVYVGGKHFNMRQHRSSYNLSISEIAEAISITHKNGKKLYYTLNSFILDSQLDELRKTLKALGDLNPDAIIVQDLAVATLAREICVHIPLHASTMMNIHNTESAIMLKMLGFTRIVTSRDIPLHEVKAIRAGCGLEMEYFIHGDMCISQSSQCYISGILFGESSNCGRCMKPCRWKWQLVSEKENVNFEGFSEGYLLARKDMCLFEHIPSLIQNDIASLKIEGRMRTAEFLNPIINAYRKAIDAYFENPVGYATNPAQLQTLFKSRVREYTTAQSFSNPGPQGVDPSGSREPRFFSYDAGEPILTIGSGIEPKPLESIPQLAVHVSGHNAAEAAVKAGADAVYFSTDGFVRHNSQLDSKSLSDFAGSCCEKNIRIAVMMPHICDLRDMAEWQHYLRQLSKIKNLEIGVSNLGGIHLARKARLHTIISDLTLNITNSIAADELSTMGISRITASTELSFEQLNDFVSQSRMPIEVIGQGPMSAMLLEHCVIAAASGINNHDVCPMPCRRDCYSLRDAAGNDFSLEPDKRCRNHIFTAADVCVLPNLDGIMSLNISALRIEAQLDTPSTVETVTKVYRNAIDALKNGKKIDYSTEIETIKKATNRPQSDGPFDFENICQPSEEQNVVRT
jgi:putative protease